MFRAFSLDRTGCRYYFYREEENMDILVSLDENYVRQLCVLLTSIHVSNPGVGAGIYLMHRGISEKKLLRLSSCLEAVGFRLFPVAVDERMFMNAPSTKQYPQEMYYRLLASSMLPGNLDRILYLDPDTLVVNSLEKLWKTDIGGFLFAAAAHTGKTELANNINRLRLKTENDYFNSGVLLINLERCRKEVRAEDIFKYVEDHSSSLLLPDQDILNALYWDRIRKLDDSIWNYDARNYSNYLLRSFGKADTAWVMENTAIFHFCGKAKPWKKRYNYRFGVLYRHYMQLSRAYFPGLSF